MGDIGNQEQKGRAKSPVPLSTAEGPFSSQPTNSRYPSRSFRSSAVPTAFHILLPATHKFPTTPPTFSSGPPPLPSLPSILHHCPLHSELSRQPQSSRLPSRPSVPRASLQPGPASPAPLAPTPLPRGAPAPRPPPPRSAQLGAGALLQGCPRAAARQGRGGPLRPAPQAHYRPRRSRFSRHGLRCPPLPSQSVQGRETEACRFQGPSRGSRDCRVCGPAGRRRGADGTALRLPGQQSPEPSRLRLTIGSGCSALPLIGAGASWPRPGAAWEMESTPGPHPRHAGSRRRPVQQSPRPPADPEELL